MATIGIEDDNFVIKGKIPQSDKKHVPQVGSIFFVPDTLGLRQKFKQFIWEGNEHDRFLLDNNKVFFTSLDAEDRYRHELDMLRAIDEA